MWKAAIVASGVWCSARQQATAADPLITFLSGKVLLPPETTIMSASAALYVTVRPDRPDNVPRALLDGSNGKPPPVLTARFPLANDGDSVFSTTTIPFTLTSEHYTIEGRPDDTDTSSLWWWNNSAKSTPLIVSARLDMDGIAATRSPDDLVGRTITSSQQHDDDISIALTGRGAFGKFATSGKK